MVRRTRTILFFICVFLVISISPLVIFYCQGYRFDFQTYKISKTGGVFLNINPKQTEIYIDGELVKKTDPFFGSVLIDNLLPKKYSVEVRKDGYSTWSKALNVKEKEVTEAKNIILFQKDQKFDTLSKLVENFWLSPDGKKIILKERGDKNWALKLYDLDKKVKSHLISETDISKTGADLMNLEFSSDSKEIYLDIGAKEQEKNFSLRLDKASPTLVKRTITEEKIPIENVVAYQKFSNEIYYLDNSGYLFKTDSYWNFGVKLNETPFSVKQETEYKIEKFFDSVFLRENQNFYLFNPDLKSFISFSEGVKDIKISPDNKKIVYYSDSEIWILFLKDILTQPPKKTGEKLFLFQSPDKINAVFWLNSDYLIFNSEEKIRTSSPDSENLVSSLLSEIKIAEIDDRDKINIVDLAEYKDLEISFNGADNKLYFLSEGGFYSSDVLLP